MRYLTIERKKSFVGCAGVFKVYVEDPEMEELRINGVPCRKLGTLKNGETARFAIGENAAALFVVSGKLSRNFSSDMIRLPAGSDDLTYTGQSRFSLFTGNAFRFDNVFDEDTLKFRNAGRRRGAILLSVCVAVGFFIGVIIGVPVGAAMRNSRGTSPKNFSESGMSITLTDAFSRVKNENFTACYSSREVALYVMKESFADLPAATSELSAAEYGDRVVQGSGMEGVIREANGLTYSEHTYTNTENGKTYHYYTAFFKSGDAFWILEFATEETGFAAQKANIVAWAKSVRFS